MSSIVKKGNIMSRNVSYNMQQQQDLIEKIIARHGPNVSRSQITSVTDEENLPYPRFIFTDEKYKVGHGKYNLAPIVMNARVETSVEPHAEMIPSMAVIPLKQKKLQTEIDNLVPEKDITYVPFGFFKNLETIIQSKQFYPIFITGLSGNGKTTMVEQICARLKRECIRVNISIETDEDDLIGGNTLVEGNIVYREGPILTAMKRGAVVILDEIDRGSNKLMCLQAILEGKPYFNKKTGEVVHAARGFNVIATANTKGRGTEDGKFIAAQILDEAFLERFPITIEQEYPSSAVEKKIILNNMEILNCVDEKFADKLVTWADIIRKTFQEGAIDELISTRRLVHIVKAFSMFADKQLAIELCINRFDEETKTAFLDLYSKIDVHTTIPQNVPASDNVENLVPGSSF